jgi:5-oxoprolinase (ATP-hydrolysing)
MGESIKMVISRNPNIRRGDVYVLNDPYHGGTHLPDITVVTPVFAPRRQSPDPMARWSGSSRTNGTSTQTGRPRRPRRTQKPDTEDEIWFYVASRGHHAEIGGVSPGSMPASGASGQQGAA